MAYSTSQRLLRLLSPRSLFAKMQAESREWKLICSCGHRVSIWDVGGIRYGAQHRSKRILRRCDECGQRSWLQMTRERA